MRRLDIGIASYGNPEGLARVLQSVGQRSRTDWHCHVVVNPHSDPAQRQAVADVLRAELDPRIIAHVQEENIGYVGAVNWLLNNAESEYVAYLDHDVVIQTDGWDETFASYLDRFHEIGIIFPNGGAYPIDRGPYTEILWGVGCCWAVNRVAAQDVRGFHAPAGAFLDPTIGHHEEVDFTTRLRLAGYKIAAAREVAVHHSATASTDPASQERIARGVVAWMDKWEKIWGGKRQGYHSPQVLRHELWPTSALYLEEYWQRKLPGLNDSPEVVVVDGQEFDLLRVPRLHAFYKGRII